MYSFLIVLFVVTGTLFLYLANRHQRLLNKPLNQNLKKVGLGLIFLGVINALFYFTLSAGIFLFLMILMVALFFIPLAILLLKRS
ncbi:hypothetical protein N474_17545 [Pseudoalteromonas luteoviolacea CPMOR-2]|uniref:Uncharacterized protein n=1 Tax=Pseudoalteromonas luteoviolacea DSM 6061 TaxID=1365250 RepID=A0A166X7X2_9GAMM|nr:hypothetical protein N475_13580 [Pseudoalteromonas luteoviolacea DSM 6061]KZN54714.1 hypothetical protein N474_17545 [Pseudoalteromonas luteoviolacea CPMOR-2]MBE0385721.1 hypothetical protein [Pseudoalteromonas luteoviolacea DSM 6061]